MSLNLDSTSNSQNIVGYILIKRSDFTLLCQCPKCHKNKRFYCKDLDLEHISKNTLKFNKVKKCRCGYYSDKIDKFTSIQKLLNDNPFEILIKLALSNN